MIKKNSNGVTLMVLIITIVTLLIILSITVISADDLVKSVQKNRLKSVMYLVKARAEVVLEDYLFDGTDKLGDEIVYTQIENVGWTKKDNDTFEYRVWDINKLNQEGIDTKNLSLDQFFIIKYDMYNNEVDVASNKGIVDENGEVCYSLSSLK